MEETITHTLYRIDQKRISDLVRDAKLPAGIIVKAQGNEYSIPIGKGNTHERNYLAHLLAYYTKLEPHVIVKTSNPSRGLSELISKYR